MMDFTFAAVLALLSVIASLLSGQGTKTVYITSATPPDNITS